MVAMATELLTLSAIIIHLSPLSLSLITLSIITSYRRNLFPSLCFSSDEQLLAEVARRKLDLHDKITDAVVRETYDFGKVNQNYPHHFNYCAIAISTPLCADTQRLERERLDRDFGVLF